MNLVFASCRISLLTWIGEALNGVDLLGWLVSGNADGSWVF